MASKKKITRSRVDNQFSKLNIRGVTNILPRIRADAVSADPDVRQDALDTLATLEADVIDLLADIQEPL